jgi:hypothetical protein
MRSAYAFSLVGYLPPTIVRSEFFRAGDYYLLLCKATRDIKSTAKIRVDASCVRAVVPVIQGSTRVMVPWRASRTFPLWQQFDSCTHNDVIALGLNFQPLIFT